MMGIFAKWWSAIQKRKQEKEQIELNARLERYVRVDNLITKKAEQYYREWELIVRSKHISCWSNDDLSALYVLLDIYMTEAVREDIDDLLLETRPCHYKYIHRASLRGSIDQLTEYLHIGGLLGKQGIGTITKGWNPHYCPVMTQVTDFNVKYAYRNSWEFRYELNKRVNLLRELKMKGMKLLERVE